MTVITAKNRTVYICDICHICCYPSAPANSGYSAEGWTQKADGTDICDHCSRRSA